MRMVMATSFLQKKNSTQDKTKKHRNHHYCVSGWIIKLSIAWFMWETLCRTQQISTGCVTLTSEWWYANSLMHSFCFESKNLIKSKKFWLKLIRFFLSPFWISCYLVCETLEWHYDGDDVMIFSWWCRRKREREIGQITREFHCIRHWFWLSEFFHFDFFDVSHYHFYFFFFFDFDFFVVVVTHSGSHSNSILFRQQQQQRMNWECFFAFVLLSTRICHSITIKPNQQTNNNNNNNSGRKSTKKLSNVLLDCIWASFFLFSYCLVIIWNQNFRTNDCKTVIVVLLLLINVAVAASFVFSEFRMKFEHTYEFKIIRPDH